LRSAAGAAGLVLGSSLLSPARADGVNGPEPTPIPGGLDFGNGTIFHVFAPGLAPDPVTSLDDDPSTITDLNGYVGLAYISGVVDQYQANTGKFVQTLPFLFSDMRFMKGTYIDRKGKVRQGTFALV
jgi:hypothetical protein